jgi:hypothetical protein
MEFRETAAVEEGTGTDECDYTIGGGREDGDERDDVSAHGAFAKPD